MKTLKIGTRGSPLALAQTQMVVDALSSNGYASEIIKVKTSGDRFQSVPLNQIGGKALFAKELQTLLLEDKIDLAVHSLKDLETIHPEGLSLLGVLKREEPNDVLITKKGFLNGDFSEGMPFVLGTCSPRREAFVKHFFKNATIVPLRGNVESRLQKIKLNEMDATILALAGLKRLNLLEKLSHDFDFKVLDIETFTPASCQGIIGIEGKDHFKEIVNLISDVTTYSLAMLERQRVKDFSGNCHSAIGVHARIVDTHTHILTRYIDPITNQMTFKKQKI
ncbi:MAG: hydroxymethylbilane synthase [Proteobacteria bacterium]|nr:hydroxymethylbilane synthase [Pseudomonadota bacterium]